MDQGPPEHLLEFDHTYDNPDRAVAINVGRLYLGREEYPVRLFLLPDGLHIAIPYGIETFVHHYEPNVFGLPKEEDEGEGK